MFTVICRLFLVIAFVATSTCAAFTAAAKPFLRVPILHSSPKHRAMKLHRPVYRTYTLYRQY